MKRPMTKKMTEFRGILLKHLWRLCGDHERLGKAPESERKLVMETRERMLAEIFKSKRR